MSYTTTLMLCLTPIALSMAGCGETNTTATSGTETGTPNATVAPIALLKPGVGPGVTVTIVSVKQKSHIGAQGYGPKAEPSETFVVVRYTIKNTSDKPLSSADRPGLELQDAAGQTYAEDTQAGILEAGMNDDIQDVMNDLNPKVTAKATAVWKVEKAAFDKATWRLKASFDAGLSAKLDKAIEWPLKSNAAEPAMFALQ